MSQNVGPRSRQPVESSSLASVGYDPASQTLDVEFRHGGHYRYFQVPASSHEALMAASSKGRFFVAEIRNRYPYERVADPASRSYESLSSLEKEIVQIP